MGSAMIRTFAEPRPNRRRVAVGLGWTLAGGLALGGLSYLLAVLVLL